MKALLVLVGLIAICEAAIQSGTSDPMCLEGSFWYDGCNNCRCIRGGAACTKMACNSSNRGKAVSVERCTDGSRWLRDNCNWCDCIDGAAVCTEKACLMDTDTREEETTTAVALDANSNEPVCEHRAASDRWREGCNWCNCMNSAVPRCTKRGCPSFIIDRLEGTKECEGTPKWKRDCNWCSCSNGSSVCTEMACAPPAEDSAPNEQDGDAAPSEDVFASDDVCKASAPSDRWRNGCNWCSCGGDGKTMLCTSRGCPAFILDRLQGTPACEGSPLWKRDCNVCHCNNGNAVCTAKACNVAAPSNDVLVSRSGTPASGYPSPVAPMDRSGNCRASSVNARWREDCNWCRCLGGNGACTRRGCPPGLRSHLDDTPECEGNIQWKRDCNWCVCKEGVAICTAKTCIDITDSPSVANNENDIRDPNVQCTEGSSWTESCNDCFCSQGHSTCTLRGCLSEIQDTCQDGARWKQDNCNWCACSNGRPSCTKKACIGHDRRISESLSRSPVSLLAEETKCTERSRWRQDGCNWCNCVNGRAVCTIMACINRDSTESNELQCIEGSNWSDGCNQCVCSNAKSICTRKTCLQNVGRGQTVVTDAIRPQEDRTGGQAIIPDMTSHQDLDETRPSIFLPRDDRDCVPGSRFMLDGCNWCSCTETGRAVCTLMACIRSPGTDGPDKICEEGSRWRKDCNWCNCYEGRAICTEMGCLTELSRPPTTRSGQLPADAECTEGSRWRNDCNWCTCNEGKSVCTLRACMPGRVDPENHVCDNGSRWKVECNWCSCLDGKDACTEKRCLPNNVRPDAADGVVVSETYDEVQCTAGSRFRQRCNWCSCTDHGQKRCTKQICHPEEDYTKERSCVGDAVFMDEDNCNWCHCLDDHAVCTEMACTLRQTGGINRGRQLIMGRTFPIPIHPIIPTEPSAGGTDCVSGTSWQEACNRCMCLNGRKTCTRRLCFDDTETNQPEQDRCTQPAYSGPCFASFRMFRFNKGNNRCEPFLYGGCQGNDNRFSTPEECYKACGGNSAVIDSTCNRNNCPEHRQNDYFAAKGCQPVYERGSCCATRYNCQESTHDRDETKCLYKGKEYNVGDTVPVRDVCSICRCGRGMTGTASQLHCISIECPSMFRPPRPGCQSIYEAESCCSVDTKCVDPTAAVVPRDDQIKCESENRIYSVGSQMYFDQAPCQKCICSEGYTGPYGSGCTNVECGYDFRYQDRIARGCVPLYYKERCCPITFICPGGDYRIATNQHGSNPEGATENVCRFDGTVVALGRNLGTTESKIRCSCKTPPDVTCVQTRN